MIIENMESFYMTRVFFYLIVFALPSKISVVKNLTTMLALCIYIYNMILRSAYLLYDADTQDGDNGSTDESFTITTTTTNFFSLFFCSPIFFSLLIVPVDERRKKEK
jgi:hypothetical protein